MFSRVIEGDPGPVRSAAGVGSPSLTEHAGPWALNREHESAFGQDEFLDGRIQAMETAYRMQFEALDVFDLRKEPERVREEYGQTPFGNGCLLARRLVERGVRTVHVFYGPGQPWDDHAKIQTNLTKRCPIWIRLRRR